jgi:hypothetical protein
MSKKYTEITGEELKEILNFFKVQRDKFSSMEIIELPEIEDWKLEHYKKGLTISLNIKRNRKHVLDDE